MKTLMKYSCIASGLLFVMAPFALAQSVDSGGPPAADDDDIVQMNVFDVTASRDVGYLSANAESATRMNVPIADIPQNIVVFNQEFLQDIGAETIADVALYDPTVTAFNEGDSFSMRGMGGAAAPGAGANYLNGFEQSGGFGSQTLVNTQRIEVLKGPNAVLYGQGAFGGTISRTSKKPDGKTDTWTRFHLTDDGYHEFRIDTRAPIIRKKLSYRVNALTGDGEAWSGSLRRNTAISPTLKWTISRRTELLAEYTYHYVKTGFTNYEFAMHNGDPLNIEIDGTMYPVNPRRSMGELDDRRELTNHIVYAEFRHEFARWLHLRIMYNSENKETENFESLPEAMYLNLVNGEWLIPRFYRHWVQKYDNYRMRAEFAFNDVKTWFIKHKLIVGFGWEDLTTDSVRWQTQYYRATSVVNGERAYPAFNPQLHLAPANILTHEMGHVAWTKDLLPRLFDNTELGTQTQSYYLSDLMSLLDNRVYLQFGLRYVDMKRVDNRRGLIYNKFASTDLTGVSYDVFREHPLTHSAGFVYHIKKNKAWTFYLNNNASFVPNYRSEYPNGPRLKSMTGNQYEAGIKYVYRDKLHTTLSFFDIKQKNVPGTGMVSYIDEDGTPRREERSITLEGLHSRGFEVNFNANIVRGWQIIGGYAYTHCINMEDLSDDYSGMKYEKRHYRTPMHAVSALTSYKFGHGPLKGLQFTFGIQWRDSMLSQYIMPDNQVRYEPKYVVPAYFNVNVGTAYAFKIKKMRFMLRLNVSNATDEMNALASYNVRVQWAAPRTTTFALEMGF